MTSLTKYDSARFALQQAAEIDEVKDIRDKAQAMAAYARQANDTKLVEWATEIKVRAERKAGQMLAEMPKNPGKLNNSSRSHDATTIKTLSELGINKTQSSRWQRLAAVPDDQFEQAIAAAKEVAGEVTTAAMLKIEKQNKQSGVAHGEISLPIAVEKLSPKSKKTDEPTTVISDDSEDDQKDQEILELSDAIISLEDENQRLKDAIAVNQLPEDEIDSAAATIDQLRKEVKSLNAELMAVKSSRDAYMRESSELKKQCAWYQKKLKQAGVK